jgi:hypothetical protein
VVAIFVSALEATCDTLQMAATCRNTVGVNLEYINKSIYFLDAFVGHFTTILQNARPNHQEPFGQVLL